MKVQLETQDTSRGVVGGKKKGINNKNNDYVMTAQTVLQRFACFFPFNPHRESTDRYCYYPHFACE